MASRGKQSKPTRGISVSAEIPKAAAGRFTDKVARALDAVTDLVSPITQAAGLIGDKIEQRRRTLAEISSRAQASIEASGKQPKLLPPKFLVPILERASLEDINDQKLIDMWSNLIATAVTDEVEMLAQYGTVLSEITSEQVRLLERMLSLSGEKPTEGGLLIDNYLVLNASGLPGTFASLAETDDSEALCAALQELLNVNGIAVDTINVFYKNRESGDGSSVSSPDGVYRDALFYDFENLARLGVVEKCEIRHREIGKFDVDIIYYAVTPVGIDLYACCNPKRLIREARQAKS